MATATDPVCGMDVDMDSAQWKLAHDGQTIYFCSKGCMLDFQDDPDRYLDAGHQPPTSMEMGSDS